MTLTTFQFPLYRLPYELGAVLAVLKNGVYAVKRSLRESRRGLFVVDLFPAHAHRIDDITNCYKPYFGVVSLRIGDIIYSSEREMDMTNFDLAAFTAKARAAHSQKRDEVWQNKNGTWSHRFSAQCEWQDEGSARTDFRFTKEWGWK